ncbi:hypothetical protein EF847_16150 [Actinobacteria bacterium YIM 96077]|uniref:Uncharacterized protein n=1 Tax=Phytoactinopolyspora halophila TaxID=1981511 RepID=A0A329QC85_9ACTN|nr:hypothetical protein [Phytoactinopolyspora halophila]AYY14007.1 hypothetical protein EF847_16150 [Actinobacteria bacterium YIM 96077]RAW10015.1 hypothetical protein DPM12_19665 [Phytoactinopolyspora halophila]
MNELDQRPKRPGVAFAGFALPFVLLVSVALAYQAGSFAGIGWHGGEYAYAFVGVAAGSVLVGSLLIFARPGSPWKSFGSGMLLAGASGGVIAIAIIVLFMIAFSQSSLTF